MAARERREKANIANLAEFLHQQERASEVEDWLRKQVAKATEEAQRRRSRHQVAAGVALRRVRECGESVANIAEQAGVSTTTVSRFLRAADEEGAADGLAADGTDGATGGTDGPDGVAAEATPSEDQPSAGRDSGQSMALATAAAS